MDADPMPVVETWDRSLRAADWQAARSVLTDDATYITQSELGMLSCTGADQIIDLMRSWKDKLPDVQVVEWGPVGSRVLARLRQPAWGNDDDWYQVLTVEDGLIRRIDDHPDRETALAAISSDAD
jgi:SnoaL-like domain